MVKGSVMERMKVCYLGYKKPLSSSPFSLLSVNSGNRAVSRSLELAYKDDVILAAIPQPWNAPLLDYVWWRRHCTFARTSKGDIRKKPLYSIQKPHEEADLGRMAKGSAAVVSKKLSYTPLEFAEATLLCLVQLRHQLKRTNFHKRTFSFF